LSQIFRKISQSHHDYRQADDVGEVNPAVEHTGKDDGKNSTDDGSDNKNLKLVQFIGLFAVLSEKICIISVGNKRQCQVFS
jgi:hypothetical protein